MGYFSNGSEGECYEETYCAYCVHSEDGCAVWMAHEQHNYKENNNKDSILHMLIPRGEHGENQQCRMFISRKLANLGLLSPDPDDWR